jgi:trk system potassium uptake protein TrkH
MSLRAYLTPLDYRTVIGQLAGLVRMMGWLLVLPAVVAWSCEELNVAGVLTGLSAVSLAFGHWGRAPEPKDLRLREAFIITALAYPLFAMSTALAFLPSASFIDGFFESMSGFTTTGLTVVDPEGIPKSLVFLRAYTQWIGGAGIVILSVAVWNATRPSGFRFHIYGSAPQEERVAGSVHANARQLVAIYGALTVVVCVGYLTAGLPLDEAVMYGLATISTGGFSPQAGSMGSGMPHASVLAVAIVGMLLGAVNFSNYQRLALRTPKNEGQIDPQLYAFAGLIAVGVTLLLVLRERAVLAVFDTVSAITTTGFSVDDPSDWSPEKKALVTLWMTIGGSSGSTAGGLKLMRFVVLLKVAQWTIRRSLLPVEARVPLKYAGSAVEAEPLRHLLGFTVTYVALIVAGGLALVVQGFAPVDALFESASAMGTVGLSSGITNAELSAWGKLVLCLQMWAGRLEVLPVLVVFFPGTWKLRGRSR